MLIYKARNTLNGKCYIGQTRGTLEARVQSHLRDASKFPKRGKYFHWALREFGADSFEWETLCECLTQDELNEREKEFIECFNADDPDTGYNLVPGGSAGSSESKTQLLASARPRDVVLTQAHLNLLGVSSKLTYWYIGSGWLVRFGAGAFIRPGDEVDWRGGLYALQSQLQMTVHVAARTALELRGLSHFVPLGSKPTVMLVSDHQERLPLWFKGHPWQADIQHHTLTLFSADTDESMTMLDCGNFSVAMSSPERAILEEIRLARTNAAIEHTLQLMENLSMLRPHLVQRLLQECTSIKAKRFFLWSAEHVQHAWLDGLDLSQVYLGSGKRQFYKGGRFDSKYQITVPREPEPPDA